MPVMPERQQTKLPDEGSPVTMNDRKRIRQAMFAGLRGGAQGALGTPSVAKPTLGA
jgi:hypothetical protein